MKYYGIKLNASLPKNSLEPAAVWSEIAGFLQYRGYLKDEYHISLGINKRGLSDMGIIEVKNPEDVEIALRKDEGSPVLNAVHKPAGSILSDQRLVYFADKGELIIFADEGHIPEDWDGFLITSKIGENITNAIQTDRKYLTEQTKHLTPPENNLFQFPALSNLRDNYLEGVSAEMWFGQCFWQYASCTKEELMACDWLKCQDRGFQLHVEAWDGPFTSAEGEQGRVQRQLLKMLFGIGVSR